MALGREDLRLLTDFPGLVSDQVRCSAIYCRNNPRNCPRTPVLFPKLGIRILGCVSGIISWLVLRGLRMDDQAILRGPGGSTAIPHRVKTMDAPLRHDWPIMNGSALRSMRVEDPYTSMRLDQTRRAETVGSRHWV